MMQSSSDYEMTLSLNVLEHLGINLYSNVPSVLSEVVANAWDADADSVKISLYLGEDQIIIKDDGIGMTREDVNNRFLRVGYRRRDEGPALTEKKRAPMGRKGIGKLSLFSVADTVEVHTINDGQKSALRMQLSEIREKIKDKNEGVYNPESLSEGLVNFEKGTRIIVSKLRRKQTIGTAKALRRRLARRFSIIGAQEGFEVYVDDDAITPADRDYYDKLQYLWAYGNQSTIVSLCRNLSREPENRSVSASEINLDVSGWVGTVHESGQLRDDESSDNLNRVAIFVRGKMAQEDILDDFSERGVYASYLIGELRVDTLDQDDEEDTATSNRQHLTVPRKHWRYLQSMTGWGSCPSLTRGMLKHGWERFIGSRPTGRKSASNF
ncbi:ATP-binding protein [Nitrosococcus wardiae]|uniref:ATP-binding protein n=1 Tax=Nitrosococcus wardiae TaxID=1814290 RepID=A0A4P7C000_9GAMM|nr:ATP-binding protein [Nitrosococcus wardiae]QBQ54937.1 hypothetical protein E3U44_10720 [Nitrosococcus wardiae]